MKGCKKCKDYELIIKIMQNSHKHDKQDIAYSLRAEYGDFIDSLDDPMDTLLGEIYRWKLQNVFNILKRHGIDIEQFYSQAQ